jgi:FlaG/FlaF family flagellin (archaellin)
MKYRDKTQPDYENRGIRMSFYKDLKESGVSPVVGVMLMLVVTIIIAAVVSAFAGGFNVDQQKAPVIALDTHVVNTGYWDSSYVSFEVKNADNPVPTKDLKIITSWTTSDGIRGGANVTGWTNKTSYIGNDTTYYGNSHYGAHSSSSPGTTQAPYGFGPGVNASVQRSSLGPGGKFWPDQMFGNYTLMSGTMMQNGPSANYGKTSGSGQLSDRYTYTAADVHWDPATDVDCVQAILGMNWNHLRQGDIVNIKFLHIPSGKIVYNKDIVVEG